MIKLKTSVKQLNLSYQERIPAAVYRLLLTASKSENLEIARSVLLTLGFHQDHIIAGQTKTAFQLMVFGEDKDRIAKVGALFKRLNLPSIKSAVSLMKPDDWASKWKRGWKPAKLTKLLDVVPLWHRDKYKPKKGRDFILMDTLMSFGTGLHETTRIVAQFIEDYRGQIGSIFDIGTGTGVLTLVALKHGIKEALAIDIGELSVEAAKKNSKLNKLPFKVLLGDIADYKNKQKFDFVAANLVTHDLVSFRKQIVRFVKPNGFLAVSGISLDNWKTFEKGFIAPPLVLIKSVKGKEWAGALFQVTSTPKT